MMGTFEITMVVKDDWQEAALREEIKELYRKYNTSQDKVELQQLDQPRSFALTVFQTSVSADAVSILRLEKSYLGFFKKIQLVFLKFFQNFKNYFLLAQFVIVNNFKIFGYFHFVIKPTVCKI